LPRWERALSGVGHGLLYALLVAAPLTGWLHASAAGLGGGGFGLFLVPDLVPKDPSLAAVFQEMHLWLTTLLAALLALHIGAALHHALVRRDGVMRRMLP
jgi:cytochrome b561